MMFAMIVGAYICIVLGIMYAVFVIFPKIIISISKSIYKWICDEIRWKKFIINAPHTKEFRCYDNEYDERYYSEK